MFKSRILISVFVISSFFSQSSWAQDVLLSETVDSTYSVSKFGPNRLHYFHTYFRFGFVIGETEQADQMKFGSNQFGLGLRYKLRIFNHLATGLELEFSSQNIFYPTTKPVLKQKYNFSDLRYAWYTRINIGKRGDVIGKYIDLGVWAANTLETSRYTKKKVDNLDFEHIEETEKSLKYINKFNYGFFVRAGVNQFMLFVEYRYTDILQPGFFNTYNNIPAWTIGLQIGLHR